METIREETKRNSRLATNVDNLRSKNLERDGELSCVFPSFEIYAFEHNFFRLLSESSRVSFKINWSQRPDYVSVEYYNSTIFWQLILYINQVNNIEEFKDFDTILVPSYESILEVLRYSQPDDIVDEIEEDDITAATKHYKKYPLDESEKEKLLNSDYLQQPELYLPGGIVLPDPEDLNWPWIPANITADDGTYEEETP